MQGSALFRCVDTYLEKLVMVGELLLVFLSFEKNGVVQREQLFPLLEKVEQRNVMAQKVEESRKEKGEKHEVKLLLVQWTNVEGRC